MCKEIICSECGNVNKSGSCYCNECGHKLRHMEDYEVYNREYCTVCGEPVQKGAKYCGKYHHKIKRDNPIKVCSVCGTYNDESNFCVNCGHLHGKSKGRGTYVKKCLNCGVLGQSTDYFCSRCGDKLIKI